MELFLNNQSINANEISAMVGYIAQKSNLCAKVINQDGEVIAVNRRGLELLESDWTDICMQMWTGFWDGQAKDEAERAVATALSGRHYGFTAEFSGTAKPTLWEVEAFPLEWKNGEVKSILVISANITATREGLPDLDSRSEMIAALSEILHAAANVATLSSASARLLKRRSDDPVIAEIAENLTEAANAAQLKIERMKAALYRS